MEKLNVTIIDDSHVWLREGSRLLQDAGHTVSIVHVSDPSGFTYTKLQEHDLVKVYGLEQADALLIDKDLGQGIDTTLFLCMVRHHLPTLPIIRWTGGYERNSFMAWLRISTTGKPTMNTVRSKKEGTPQQTEMDMFPDKFMAKVEEQRLQLGSTLDLAGYIHQTLLSENQENDGHGSDQGALRMRQISQMVALADDEVTRTPVLDEDGLPARDYHGYARYWCLSGSDCGVLKHELGHAICDGNLTPEQVQPFLPNLKKVVERLRDNEELDDRFQLCADFLLSGKPAEEMVLIYRCY
jgi:hypothetical protein